MTKKLIATIALIAFIGTCISFYTKPITTFAEEGSIVTEKMNFAMKMDNLYAQTNSINSLAKTDLNYNDLVSQAFFAKGEEKKQLLEELSAVGIYCFSANSTNSINESTSSDASSDHNDEIMPNGLAIYPACGTTDVTIYAPEIYYQASNRTWIVSCGGQWNNGKALPTFSLFETNIGGPDAFGVGYTSIKTAYNSSIVQAYAYIADHIGSQKVTTNNRSDGDGSLGFAFQLQDRQLSTPTFTTYIGHIWYGACTYDEQFASFDAVATGFYTHTYYSSTIKKISFGVHGKSAGIDVDVTEEENHFTGFGADTKF